MNTPNLFDFATSELSQDAVLAWLISWADDEYKDNSLSLIGKKFLSLLTNIPAEAIHTVKAGRQWEHIDVWVEVNENTFLVIEDKTSTTHHGTQLEDYANVAYDYYKGKRDNIVLTYIKTGNEPQYLLKNIEETGYKTFSRGDILKVLNTYENNNAILCDFRNYLQEIEDSTNRYLDLPMADWDSYAWQGFYMKLNESLPDLEWGYVPNQTGGFWGAWFNSKSNAEVDMYLQFEENKLCFKISVEDPDMRRELREKYYTKLMELTTDDTIQKPDRFGCGNFMTIAVAVPPFLKEGKIDLQVVLKTLEEYSHIIERCLHE